MSAQSMYSVHLFFHCESNNYHVRCSTRQLNARLTPHVYAGTGPQFHLQSECTLAFCFQQMCPCNARCAFVFHSHLRTGLSTHCNICTTGDFPAYFSMPAGRHPREIPPGGALEQHPSLRNETHLAWRVFSIGQRKRRCSAVKSRARSKHPLTAPKGDHSDRPHQHIFPQSPLYSSLPHGRQSLPPPLYCQATARPSCGMFHSTGGGVRREGQAAVGSGRRKGTARKDLNGGVRGSNKNSEEYRRGRPKEAVGAMIAVGTVQGRRGRDWGA